MARKVDLISNQLDERLIIDHSGYDLYREQHNSRSISTTQSKGRLSIIAQGTDEFQDEHEPSEDFSALPAQFCPATVRACSPLTMNWFEVTIDNLAEIVWAKDSAEALVMPDPTTKDTLAKLIQAHSSAQAGDAPSDFIEGKGQVKFF